MKKEDVKIIQIIEPSPKEYFVSNGSAYKDIKIRYTIFGLGDDGLVYIYSAEKKVWFLYDVID